MMLAVFVFFYLTYLTYIICSKSVHIVANDFLFIAECVCVWECTEMCVVCVHAYACLHAQECLTLCDPMNCRPPVSNQSILKEISPGCSLEGLMLKLKLIVWPPHTKSWLIGKDSDAGRDWGQEEKGTTEDKMAGWYR